MRPEVTYGANVHAAVEERLAEFLSLDTSEGGCGTAPMVAALTRCLGPDQPAFGLQSPGMLGEWPPTTIGGFAQRQVAEILRRDPTGPCSLAGHCAGGLLALEIARLLTDAGKPVLQVALIDSLLPGRAPGVRSGSPRRRLTDWVAQRVRILRWRARLAADTPRQTRRLGLPGPRGGVPRDLLPILEVCIRRQTG